MAQKIKYFGPERMAAYQDKHVARHNKDLVKYKPQWGLGPKGALGSHNEGWNPTIGLKARDEQMVDIEPRVAMYPGHKKKIPFTHAAGLYWTGGGMRQLDPERMMQGTPRSSSTGITSSADPSREKASGDMMKGFKMLHKASPELQSLAPISDWDDVSPNMIKGIMSGLQLMGSAQELGRKSAASEKDYINQDAMRSALSAGEDPLAMMRAYAEAGGSDLSDMKSMQDILEGPWKPKVGEMDGKQYMMTSPRSAVWDKSKTDSDLKIPYQGPVIKRDGVTFLWSDKDKSYKGTIPKPESPTDQYLRQKLGLGSMPGPKARLKGYGKWSLE